MDAHLQNGVIMYEGTRYETEGVVDTFGWRMAVWQMVNRKYLKVPENLVVAEELSIDKKNPNSDGRYPDVNVVIGVVIGRKG